ncbi:YqeG family HAD IIIA-type phosphatase [Mycoplasmatota bacterium]|nr:YqeG family HAD IIIA-type phosphatase [Mycoplasmatota bacterium]
MLKEIFKAKMYLPRKNYQTVYDIDFNKLYSEGKRYILTDLDNTIISYSFTSPTDEVKEFFKKLKEIGFQIAIVSNSPISRVKKFLDELDVYGIASCKKPLLNGVRRALNYFDNPSNDEVILLGDQLLTDVLVGNRLGIEVYFVMPLEETSEKWYTKLNRTVEKIIARRVKRKHPDLYKELLGDRYGD